jgi:NAD(P)-dependent dehydrogenase (short-subunit alcohol dehydrogenase family)
VNLARRGSASSARDPMPFRRLGLRKLLKRGRTYLENGNVLGRLPTLDEVANAAVFMASGRASVMTGTVANLTWTRPGGRPAKASHDLTGSEHRKGYSPKCLEGLFSEFRV